MLCRIWTLQVRLVDDVHVDDPDRADASGRQVQGGRRTQPAARAQTQHLGIEQLQLALFAHLGQQQVPLVAVALRRLEHRRLLPVTTLVLPPVEATVHRDHVAVVERRQRLRSERRANTARAHGDDLGVLGGNAVLDVALELATWDVNRAGDGPLFVLVGLADIEQGPALRE